MSDTRQSDLTVASNGDVEPDAPTANSGTALVDDEPLSQSILTCAVTLVPTAGDGT